MTKQEQIEEMAVLGCVRNPQAHTAEECANCDFKQGQCNAYRHAEKLYNAGYRKIKEKDETLEKQIKHLNTIVERLDELLGKGINEYIMGIDGVDGLKDMWERSAVRKFAEKVKEEVYPFLQAEMYNKKHFITGDSVSDKLLENQNIGILKAQDVLSKWFKVKIDELLKEYE